MLALLYRILVRRGSLFFCLPNLKVYLAKDMNKQNKQFRGA